MPLGRLNVPNSEPDLAVDAHGLAFGREALDPEIAGLDDVDVPVRADGDIRGMKQLAEFGTGPAEFEQQPARALVEHLHFVMPDVHDIQPFAGNRSIDGLELPLRPVRRHETVIAVIDEDLVAPGVGHVLGPVPVDRNVDRPFHPAVARTRHESEAPLHEIEDGKARRLAVGDIEPALEHRNAIRLTESLRVLVIPKNEFFESLDGSADVVVARYGLQMLYPRRVRQWRIEHTAGCLWFTDRRCSTARQHQYRKGRDKPRRHALKPSHTLSRK